MANKTVQSVRGFHDILPEKAREFRLLEEISREVFGLYGFEELKTPTVEKTELFSRSVGEATDIVGKEMYTFTDQGGESLSLRPEGTAAVVRAYLEHGYAASRPESRFFYIGPMYRRERPQHGRLRQFHQVGAELFGLDGPGADAEIISLQVDLFARLGIPGCPLHLNSLGCRECQPAYRAALLSFLEPIASDLCPDCRRRIATNPLRTLDCKEEKCRVLLGKAPQLPEFLCTRCEDHFAELTALLDSLGIAFEIDSALVRGLDYYTRTAFEFFPPSARKKTGTDAISAGGRYDELIADLGGPRIPAVGFALGVERVLLLPRNTGVPSPSPRVFLLGLGSPARREAMRLARTLREHAIPAQADQKGGSLKAQLHRADNSGAAWVLIIGDNELKEEIVLVRNLQESSQEKVPVKELLPYLTDRIKSK